MSKNNVPKDISEIGTTTNYMQQYCFWVCFVLVHLYAVGIYFYSNGTVLLYALNKDNL